MRDLPGCLPFVNPLVETFRGRMDNIGNLLQMTPSERVGRSPGQASFMPHCLFEFENSRCRFKDGDPMQIHLNDRGWLNCGLNSHVRALDGSRHYFVWNDFYHVVFNHVKRVSQ
jgi:hypothetical protein